MKFETDDYIVEYDDTPELRDAVFDKVMEYFKKHDAYCGESICQMDDPMIDAPYVMADIVDNIIKFDYDCK
jgi:hypothetical protein